MPTEYQESPADEFDYFEDWQELLDPAGEDAITSGSMEATLTGLIDFNKIRSCARHFLGYSYVSAPEPESGGGEGGEEGSGEGGAMADYALHREPPAAHPRWGNLYAHGISFRGLNPKSNDDNATGAPYEESPFDPDLYTSTFEKAVVTVRYRSFGRMRFLPDSDIGDYTDEWKRWVSWQTSPSIEALSADGGSQLKFAEGGSFFEVTGPTAGQTPFAAPVAVLLSKCNFVMTWMHVPHNYISTDPDILIPKRILHCMGKTNSADFLGFETGTLLMQPPAFEPVLFPVVAADSYDLITGWNVHIPFSFFNPDTNAAGARISVVGSTYFGHNLMPFRNGGFYLATRNGVATGPKLLPETDFYNVFKHVLQPDT